MDSVDYVFLPPTPPFALRATFIPFHQFSPLIPHRVIFHPFYSILERRRRRARNRELHTRTKKRISPKKYKGQQQPGQQQLPQRFLRIKPRNEGRAASPGRCCGSGCCKKKERNTMFFCPHSERRRPRERSVLPAAQASSKNPSRWRLLWIEGQVAGVE